MKLRLALVIAAMAATGLTVAAPAGADNDQYCEPRPMGVTYCDGPIHEDGSWRRCFSNAPTPFYGQYGQVAGVIPQTGNCYDVPGEGRDPYPWAPQNHLQP